MNKAPFQVMDASAGSGKTRNLVKAVLVQTLEKENNELAFRSIMAITFTNKAAAEMKGRLLEYLIAFAQNPETEEGLIAEIAAEIGSSPQVVCQRSKKLLKYILHHYNDLSFGTIDSFTSRLVRTFAKDLALSENFEIVLDLEPLLNEATDQVINQAGEDPVLTKMLVDFVERKLEDEKNWSIDGALNDVAKKLLQERHRERLSKLRDFTPEDFARIRKNLQKRRKVCLTELENIGKRGNELMEENNVAPSSIAGGALAFPHFFNYLQDARLLNCLTFTPTVQKNIDADKWYSGKATPADKIAIDAIKDELLTLATHGRDLAIKTAPFILLAEKIIENSYALGTLTVLDNALSAIEEAQNIMPLAAFNHIVNSKIKDEPAPYIFERLGERYKHFYIDEFQDTSKLQWENLLPLVENSIASIGSTLLVGDAKQSIYRWRNGEAEQFVDLSQRAETGTISTAINGELIRLEDNWRSRKTIVEFNNALFASAANHLENEAYNKLYSQAAQNSKKEAGGYAEVKLLDSSNFEEEALAYTLELIENSLKLGFNHKDIALLVRSNKDGQLLVNELSSRGYPVVSGDSLLLGKSYEGKLLSGFLALRSSPKNKRYRWALAEGLLEMGLINTDLSPFTFGFNLVNTNQAVDDFLEEHFPGFSAVLKAPTDLYTYLREVTALLNLDVSSNAFLQAFLQAVHSFVENENGTSYEFISWWEEKGFSISISAPEEMDALRVSSIHKSKGLQYPIVIIPFTKWLFYENNREAWLNLDPEEFEGLTEILLAVSGNNAKIIGGEYAELFDKLLSQEKFDSLNMLYVACTRAEEHLYIMGKEKAGSRDIFTVVQSFIEDCESNRLDDRTFAWGEKSPPLQKTESLANHPINKIETEGWQNKVKLALNAPKGWENKERDARTWGNKVHYILSRIKTVTDVKPALAQLRSQGTFEGTELPELDDLITEITSHPLLKSCFEEGVVVYNERDIIIPNQKSKRPDRITKTKSGQIVLMDYKTGEPENKHKTQLLDYAGLLTQAGIEVLTCYLVYINSPLCIVDVAKD